MHVFFNECMNVSLSMGVYLCLCLCLLNKAFGHHQIMDLYLQFTIQEMKTVVIHEFNLYAFMSVCMHVREFACMCVA